MGLLVDGQWHNQWYDTKASNGKFIRSESQFRNWITADGQAGPTGKAGFKAEAGRYHLYISLHRHSIEMGYLFKCTLLILFNSLK